LLGLYLLWRRRNGDSEASTDAEPGGEPTSAPDTETRTGADGAAGATATTDEEPDPELLSDEERVEYLLERNGGRMKQANIVKETGWSNAKVSQLLSSMEEEGRVDKLRIGRENLISLPDEGLGEIPEDDE
jgi:predicted Rossmann fold nucleotide-binding protein DprA/Smf involved in DNA uptake